MDDESHLLILIEKEETSKRLGGHASGVYRLKKAIQLDKRFTIRGNLFGGAYEYVN